MISKIVRSSKCSGWLCVLGWQTGIASIAFLAGGQIQGLVILNNASYVPERWHGTLLVIAVSTFSILFNTLLARKLPLVEGIVLVLHIFGFFAVFITMWVLGPRSPSKKFSVASKTMPDGEAWVYLYWWGSSHPSSLCWVQMLQPICLRNSRTPHTHFLVP